MVRIVAGEKLLPGVSGRMAAVFPPKYGGLSPLKELDHVLLENELALWSAFVYAPKQGGLSTSLVRG